MSLSTADFTGNPGGGSKFITAGINNLKIVKYEVKTAGTGAKKLILYFEGKPKGEGFVGHENALGLVGKVQFPYAYVTKNTESQKRFMKDLSIMADKLAVKDRLDSIKVENLDDSNFDSYINQIMPFLMNKFAWWKVTGEEYSKAGTDKPGLKLSLAKYGFIQDEKSYAEKCTLTFDKTSEYDYIPLVKYDTTAQDTVQESVVSKTDDLPF